jgi:hypothetical protein
MQVFLYSTDMDNSFDSLAISVLSQVNVSSSFEILF